MTARAYILISLTSISAPVTYGLQRLGFPVDAVETWLDLEAALISGATTGQNVVVVISSSVLLNGGVELLMATEELLRLTGSAFPIIALNPGHEAQRASLVNFSGISHFLMPPYDESTPRQLRDVLVDTFNVTLPPELDDPDEPEPYRAPAPGPETRAMMDRLLGPETDD